MVATRYYSCVLQTWPNRDPIGERGGGNLYGVLRNNTINQVDEYGLMTRTDVDEWITRMAHDFSQIECCCMDHPFARATLTGTSRGDTVTLSVDVDQFGGKCPIGVVTYFWWDCVTAQSEGGALWDVIFPWRDVNAWQRYGWRAGGQTETARHRGRRFPGLFDANHWNWQAVAVILYCDGGGHLTVKGEDTNQWQFTWDANTESWGDPGDPFQ